jgi:hypothetical protein
LASEAFRYFCSALFRDVLFRFFVPDAKLLFIVENQALTKNPFRFVPPRLRSFRAAPVVVAFRGD